MNNTRTRQVMESMHTMKRLKISEALGLMHGSEFLTLNTISRLSEGENSRCVCASDIASKLCISGPAVSRSLNRLEDKGFIKRAIGKNDRRNVYIEITPSGCEELELNMQKYTEFMEITLSHLSEEEMSQFTMICNKIVDVMKTELEKINK